MKTRTGIIDTGEREAARAGRDVVLPLLMDRESKVAPSNIGGSGDGEGPPSGRGIKVGATPSASPGRQ